MNARSNRHFDNSDTIHLLIAGTSARPATPVLHLGKEYCYIITLSANPEPNASVRAKTDTNRRMSTSTSRDRKRMPSAIVGAVRLSEYIILSGVAIACRRTGNWLPL